MHVITADNVSNIIKRLDRRSFLSNPLFLQINCQYEERGNDLIVAFSENELAFPTSNPEHMRGKSVWCYASELAKFQSMGLVIEHQEPHGIEYFYKTQKLINMPGKHYKTIRNQINSFKDTYPTLRLSETCDKELAKQFVHTWHQQNAEKKTGYSRETFDYEYASALKMIELVDKTPNVHQLYVFIDERLAAMTFFGPIHDQFWAAIIQKIDSSYHGIGKFLYQEKARRMQAYPDCTLGDDGKDPALAKFKRSLQPEHTDQLTVVEFA